jgi:plastocyanin
MAHSIPVWKASRMPRGYLVVAGALAALALAPAAAPADTTITAQTVWHFDAMSYTLTQGGKLTFANMDQLSPGPHNVTAQQNGSDGKPLFSTPSITNGQTAPVPGASALAPGSYPFLCTVHPFMTATLVVSAAPGGGSPQPQPQPQPAPDARAPAVTASIASASLRAKSFKVRVASDEDAALKLRMIAGVGRRTVLVGTPSGKVSAGVPTTVVVHVSARARKALRTARKATLRVGVEARDAAGNVGGATAKRVLARRAAR